MGDANENHVTKKTKCFYFVKIRSYEIQILKTRMEEAEKLMQCKGDARIHMAKALYARKMDREKARSDLRHFSWRDKLKIDWIRNEMDHLQQALVDRCWSMNYTHGRANSETLSSLGQLNNLIKNLQWQLQHGSNNRAKEKQLLQEIKQAEEEREALVANADERPFKIPKHINSIKAIEHRIKVLAIESEMEELKNKGLWYRTIVKNRKKELKAAEKDINSYHKKLENLNQNKTEAHKSIVGLNTQTADVDVTFQEYLTVMNSAKELVTKKDISGLMELSTTQVKNFMSQWNKSRDFRDDYESRSSPFLESRLLNMDGMRTR